MSVIYRQYDSRWGSLSYPTGNTMAGSGCGPTSCANVIANISNNSITPKDTRSFMLKGGYAVKNQGTAHAGIPACLKNYGYTVTECANMSAVWTSGKKQGIILFKAGTVGNVTWTTGGHYVAFTDYKVTGGKHYFYTRDSGSRKNDGWHCYETTMKGLIYKIWVCAHSSSTKITCTISYNANGGNGAPSKQTYTYAKSGTTTLSSVKPSRSGYTFLGWATSASATSAKYTAGQKWNLSNKGNYTLYAVWKKTKQAYTGTFPTSTVKKGSTGQDVKRVQMFLNWYLGKTVLTVDGICGNATVAQIKVFQKAMGLTVDGICGTNTIAKMKTVKK